ncbi:efflux RND transporter periplasmic adaptor subunit [Alkaliphilus peptidifermentans]|uniref:HlyD family secretion protein n=1 Tax=Alkaliphilus peptidifermentans DSM 18978 TaxID=1120976 RepID=A0A1G5IEN4_9FIRM|nr:efflux RND transporter periplasmic adaptor subunit [Alkaliphilus peptidifermentans]SCY74150.1 HlyD family secretion protein [Alkaliphilus peptidifermentans DSM 18978]
MEKKGKKKIIVIIVVLLIAAGITAAAVSASKGGKQGITVDVATIEAGDISVKIPANGLLEEVERELVFHDSESAGKVETVEVEVGDTVTKGQVLATLDSVEFGNKLSISETQLEVEKLNLQRLKKSRQESMDDTLRQLEEAKKSFERSKELFENGAISQLEYEQNEKNYQDIVRSYEQFTNNEDSLYYEILKTEKQIKVSQLTIQDTIRQMEKNQGDITSPIDGIVTEVNARKGFFISPSTPAFIVADTTNLQIRINVSEYDISKVRQGQKVEIESDALANTLFNGIIEKIAPTASKISTGQTNETVVPVTINVIDQHEMLKPGFSVKARIVSEERENTIVLPFDSIIVEDQDKRFVFVCNDNVLEKREVEIGIESDFHVEIVSGLTMGEKIVLRPNMTLNDGDLVTATEVNNK